MDGWAMRARKVCIFCEVLIDAIPMPIYYKDIQGIYRGCNKTFETMFGLSEEDIIGKTVSDIWPKELADIYHKMDQGAIQPSGNTGLRLHVSFC